jgi:hypothetical protein
MADLLSRLVAQTLGRGEIVQPRIAPLFAYEQSPDAFEVLASLPEQGPVNVWDRQGVSGARSSTPSGLEPPTAPVRRSEAADDPWGASDQAAHLVAPPRTIAPRPDFRQAVSSVDPEQRQAVVAAAQDPPFPTLTSPQTRSATRHPAPLVPLPAHDDAMMASLSEQSGDRRPDETSLPSASLISSRAAAVRTPPQARADGNRRQSGEVTEPAVHVTIGRIDVRAVMPDPPPAPSAPRPEPRLTIEEYSRQRREGLR